MVNVDARKFVGARTAPKADEPETTLLAKRNSGIARPGSRKDETVESVPVGETMKHVEFGLAGIPARGLLRVR